MCMPRKDELMSHLRLNIMRKPSMFMSRMAKRQNHGHHFTGGAHKWQGVTAVLCSYGGAASLLTQWVQTQVWVIDFCCTIALFLQVQPSFPLIALLLLLSLTLNVFVPAVELPPSGPPRQLWCHLLKTEVSRRQTPELSLLARGLQIDAFFCKQNCE